MVDMVDTEAMVMVWDTVDLVIVDTMANVRLKLNPRLMLIPTTMVVMDWEDMVDMVDMVDTEAMVMVWDTVDLAIVDTMANVRLKLSPRLMLIPTTMVDMDWEDTADMVDMVDTEAMVMVWDTVDLAIVDTMENVRLKLNPRLLLIPTTMVD